MGVFVLRILIYIINNILINAVQEGKINILIPV